MNIEELRKLKSKIEEERNRNFESKYCKYYEMNSANLFTPNAYFFKECFIDENSITIDEIKSSENTNEVVKKCEEVIENILLYLSKNDISYDQIKLIAQRNFYCKTNFAKKIYGLKWYFSGSDDYDFSWLLSSKLKVDERINEYQELLKELPNQICTTYFPVEFKVDLIETGTEELPVNYDNNFNYNNPDNIKNINIKGVIDINKFVQKMSSLGYDVEISPINQYDDYKNGKDLICITADFGRKKDYSKK